MRDMERKAPHEARCAGTDIKVTDGRRRSRRGGLDPAYWARRSPGVGGTESPAKRRVRLAELIGERQLDAGVTGRDRQPGTHRPRCRRRALRPAPQARATGPRLSRSRRTHRPLAEQWRAGGLTGSQKGGRAPPRRRRRRPGSIPRAPSRARPAGDVVRAGQRGGAGPRHRRRVGSHGRGATLHSGSAVGEGLAAPVDSRRGERGGEGTDERDRVICVCGSPGDRRGARRGGGRPCR